MAPAPSYEKLPDPDQLRNLVGSIIAEGRPFAHDTETGYDGESREKASLHPEENFLVSWQFTNALTWARMVPLRFDSGLNCDNYEVARILWPLFQAKDAEGLPLAVAHGHVFELRGMRKWFLDYLGDDDSESGEQVRACDGYFPIRSCTLIESYVEAANQFHGLKLITKANFGHEMREIFSLFPEGLTEKQKKSIRFNVLDPDDPEVVAYSCEDAVWCLAHHGMRYPKVRDNLIYRIEMGVLPIIAEMADTGVCFDWNLMRDGSRRANEFAERYIAEVVADFSELAGEPVNISFSSPRQFADLLYNKCKMPVTHRTRGGKSGKKQPSVDQKQALPDLARQYPQVRKYLGWKRLTTLCTNYLDKYERDFSYAPDGRAHPQLISGGIERDDSGRSTGGTITGRTSCEEPNVQQCPKKYHYELADGTVFDFNFRDCITAPPGWYILGFDYSQIQLRIAAGEYSETALLQAFADGTDVHRLSGALMTGKLLEDVTEAERAVGKTFNLSLLFGLTVDGMADRLGCTIEEAERLFAQYHAAYPALKRGGERTIAESKRAGYVTTRFGRKVRIWEYDSPLWPVQNAGERTAGNAPIQGGEADYVKIAMVRLCLALRAAGLDGRVKLFMHGHDALELYVRKDVTPAEVIRVLQPAVVFPVDGWPPMVAEWHMGERWGSVIELDVLDDGTIRPKGAGKPAPGPAEAKVTAEPEGSMPVARPSGAAPEAPYPAGADGLAGSNPAFSQVPPAQPDGPARTVIITAGRMPDAGQVQALVALLDSVPGVNAVELHTPAGSFPFGRPCGLVPDLEPQVSIILGGAQVRYDPGSVDSGALMAGLSL